MGYFYASPEEKIYTNETRCKNLKCDEDGVTFCTKDEDGNVIDEYRTSRDGDGLWVKTVRMWDDYGNFEYEWRQIEGTSQFSLRGIMTASGVRKYVNRYLARRYG